MTITTHWWGHRCSLHVEQEMNIYTALELKESLLVPLEKSQELTIDLSLVSEMDTTGIQLLLLLHRESIRREISIHISAMSNSVREALSLYGLLSWFNVTDVLPPEGVRP